MTFINFEEMKYLVFGIFLLSSCSKPISSLFKGNCVKQSNSPYVCRGFLKDSAYSFESEGRREIKLTYTGCGGFFIRNEHSGVLIDPFFSNKRFVQTGILPFRTRPGLVEHALNPISDLQSKTKGIFITHAHYDHLMDAPYVAVDYLNNTKPAIHVSTSGETMIDSIPGINVVNIEQNGFSQWHGNRVGQHYDFENGPGTLRVWPIATTHAPHTKNKRFYDGESKKSKALSKTMSYSRAGHWRLGQTFSFLIEFLDANGKREFLIYVQSSAAPPDHGWIPPALFGKEDTIDLAIMGAASYANTNDYPEALVRHLRPKRIIICHWEDFFNRYKRKKKRLVRRTDIAGFVNRLNAVFPYTIHGVERFVMPIPGITGTVFY